MFWRIPVITYLSLHFKNVYRLVCKIPVILQRLEVHLSISSRTGSCLNPSSSRKLFRLQAIRAGVEGQSVQRDLPESELYNYLMKQTL